MPCSKNQFLRYVLLDELFSSSKRDYTRAELTDEVNRALNIRGYCPVSERTVETDIHDMENLFGFDFDSYISCGKRYLRYPDSSFRAFARPLSEDDKKLLYEILNTLGQFSDLDNFGWVKDLKEKLSEKNVYPDKGEIFNKTISFSQNEFLIGRNNLAWFFNAISNKTVVRMTVRSYKGGGVSEKIVYPYMLKQYNNRWYLIGTPIGTDVTPYQPEKLENYPLDRIDRFELLPHVEFKECPLCIEEYYEDVIGLTNDIDAEVMNVVMAVDPIAWEYIQSKALHWSQARLVGDELHETRTLYDVPDEFVFFKIRCKDNYELRSVIRSFGSDLLVLSPASFRDKVVGELIEQWRVYSKISATDF